MTRDVRYGNAEVDRSPRHHLGEGPARVGAPEADHGVALGDVGELDRAVVRQVKPEPAQVAGRRAGSRRHPERGLPEARHRHVALDAAPGVQALRVDEAPGRAGHVVAAEPLEEVEGPGSGHVELAERRHVEHAHALAHGPVLARHVLPVARALPGPLVGALPPARAPGNEVVGPLPAPALPEHGALREQPLEKRARPERPAPLVLVARELGRVVVAVHLARLLGGVPAVAEVGPEAADVQLPHVDGGLALEDPLGHHAARRPPPLRSR